MIGLPIAIALGAIIRRPELELQVLRDVSPELVEQGKQMIADGKIVITLASPDVDKLHIDVTATAGKHKARAVISGGHTRFVFLELDGEEILNLASGATKGCKNADTELPDLTLRKVWEFATTAPLADISFILETRKVNKAAAEQAFTSKYGHAVGRTLHCQRQRAIMGDSIFSRILSYTSAACDARMGGAQIPVMSNSDRAIRASRPPSPWLCLLKRRLRRKSKPSAPLCSRTSP